MNAPKRIWVDTCKDADGEPEWDTGAWSLNQEQDDDKEYVRADLFAKAIAALRFVKPLLGNSFVEKRALSMLAELEGETK